MFIIIIMKIEISEKDYKVLLKWIATADYIYWIMWDLVSSKYKQDSESFDKLIHKLLWYVKDDSIVEIFDWKRVFSEDFQGTIIDEVMEFEDYNFWDLLVRNMTKELIWHEIHWLDEKTAMKKIFEMEEKIRKEFELNGLKNFKFTWEFKG